MKKILTLILLLFTFSFSYSQNNYTFCYGSIAVTIFGNGDAEMIRYNSSAVVVSRVKGNYTLYGKGDPTEVLKIEFQGNEYRYDLIRDGFGTPSKIFDNQMREYTLCKTTQSKLGDNTIKPYGKISFFTGTYFIPNDKIKIVISNVNGKLNAVVYKDNKIYKFNTTCGEISKFTQQEEIVKKDESKYEITLLPEGCNEPIDKISWLPNYIELSGNDNTWMSMGDPNEKYYYLSVNIKSVQFRSGAVVKKIKF